MITRDELMPRLLKASPSFFFQWRSYITEPEYDPELLYLHLAEFSRHLIVLLGRHSTAELRASFEEIERFHAEGDSYVREAATIGLLEALQNNAEHEQLDPDASFRSYLGPQSARAWEELNRFWRGDPPAPRRV